VETQDETSVADRLKALSTQLDKIKITVDDLSQQRFKLQGKIEAAQETMNDKFKVSTIQAAEEKLKRLHHALTTMSGAIEEKMEELRGYLRSVGHQIN
jgi:nicotinate-nucleotide pyrophosphorylase